MKSKKKITVVGVILAYNCADLIEDTYKRIPTKSLNSIILVDDGSTDNTVAIAKKLGISTFSHKHLGYGGNIKFGLKQALSMGADYIVEIHGDGQYDPKAIPAALETIQNGYSLLLGSRFVDIKQPLKDKMPLFRYVINIISSYIYDLVLRVKLTEFHTGFHIFSKEFLLAVGFADTSNGHPYSFEIILQACFKHLPITEIPIRCDYAKYHTSINVKKSTVYMLETFYLLGLYVMAQLGFKFKFFKRY